MPTVRRFGVSFLVSIASIFGLGILMPHPVFAVATESTLTVGHDFSTLFLDLYQTVDGNFGTSGNANVSISTDNFTGYSMYLSTTGSTTSLVSTNSQDEIASISSPVSEQTFSTSSALNNKWGIKPSHIVTGSGSTEAMVANSDYLPVPSGEGLLFAKTSAKNSSTDNYTYSVGARVDYQIHSGEYSATYVVYAIANTIVFNVTYDANYDPLIAVPTDMPSPNPQALSIDGGTPVAQSYASLSSSVPKLTGKEFVGWCNAPTTIDSTTGNYVCSGTVYDAGDDYPIDQTDAPNITLYAIWNEKVNYVCKIAKAGTLHTDTCHQSSGDGCRAAGYANNAVIEYGQIVSSSTMTPGDAYDCDVNNDGDWDDDTERFYYFGTENSNAKFVYHKSLENSDQVYTDAITFLPTATTWSNPNLITFSGDFAGKVGRFMTYQEANNLCGTSDINVNCKYLLEKSGFAYPMTEGYREGIWLQKDGSTATRIQTKTRVLTHGKTTANTPRPTIEVPTEYVEPYTPTDYVITFDPHNETSSWTENVHIGDPLGSAYPANDPQYTNHIFQGWYTSATGGFLIDNTTTPTADTTYHAQWKKTVALAELQSSNIEVLEDGTATIVVNNASELEEYTFTSTNPSVASVDSNTGVITGHTESSTTITMTGTTSGQTKTINVQVVSELSTYVCTLAQASTLHTVNNVTYGQVATNPTPQAGDAYDCDVDNNGIFDPSTERFYYLTNENNNAVLVAFNSYVGNSWAPGSPTDLSKYLYADALNALPSNAIGAWDNPYLIEQASGKAARFMKKSEVEAACNVADVTATGALLNCPYLMEHTAFDGGGRTALWLMHDGNTYWRIHTDDRHVASADPETSENMARPAIVVPQDKIEKYQAPPAQTYTVTFNPMGGSSVNPVTIESNTALSQDYPADPTRSNHMFFGWYTDTNYTTEVTPETVINGDVTYYARWVGNTSGFPILFHETNECVFEANKITGTYCGHTSDTQYYINSGLRLFTNGDNGIDDPDDMYLKDFEIGLTITEYDPNDYGPDTQATFVNSKLESSGYPGFVLRRNSSNLQLTAKFGNSGNPRDATRSASLVPAIFRIVRRDGKMYYAWNDNELTLWHDISNFSTRFDTEVWFGGATASNGTSPMRPLKGKMTDMYIRVGTFEEDSGYYTITFDGNGGTPSEETRPVDANQPVGSLPTVTRAGNYTFLGWYDEDDTLVTASTVPTKSQTYHAEWDYTASDTPVLANMTNDAMRGYYSIIESWTNSSVNITQFNKDTTSINNSTWGNPSVLSEAGFQTGLRTNFELNNCDMNKGYNGSTESRWEWNSGSVNCSKPNVFDTGVGGPLTVYLYDTSTSTLGNKVYYTKSDNGTLTNLVPGKTYKWVSEDDSSIYGYVTAQADHGTRFIDAGDTSNVRDIGGLEVDNDNDGVADGTLKYEKIYRGGAVVGGTDGVAAITNLAKTSDNIPGDIIEYDVAGNLPAGFPTTRSYSVLNYVVQYTSNNMTNYNTARNAVNSIMDDIIAGNNAYIHCRVGADRTGTVLYILEGLLGVSDEDRYREFELTHLGGLTDRTRYYKTKGENQNKFVFMMDYLLTKGDIMTWYMAGSSDTEQNHPDRDRITAFRNAMINAN